MSNPNEHANALQNLSALFRFYSNLLGFRGRNEKKQNNYEIDFFLVLIGFLIREVL